MQDLPKEEQGLLATKVVLQVLTQHNRSPVDLVALAYRLFQTPVYQQLVEQNNLLANFVGFLLVVMLLP